MHDEMLLPRSGVYKRGGDGTLVGGLPRHIAGLDVPLLILMRCRFNKDIICLLTLMELGCRNPDCSRKATGATTTGAVVEEVVLQERRKFPLENLDEFEEREHHMSRALQNNAVSYILN